MSGVSMFANMKVATRLGLGFAVVVMLLLVLSFLGVWKMGSLNETSTEIVDLRIPQVRHSDGAIRNSLDIGVNLRDMFLSRDPAAAERMQARVQELRSENNKVFAELETLVKTKEGQL